MLKHFLYFLIFYIPFQVALNLAEGFDIASIRVLILILFSLWLISSLVKKKLFIPNKIQTGFLMFFLFFAFLSLFQAPILGWGVRKLLVFLSIFPLYFIVAGMVYRDPKLFKNILKILVYSAFFIALIGIIQFSLQFITGVDSLFQFWAENVAPIFYGKTATSQIIQTPSWAVNISGLTIFRAISLFPDPHMLAFYIGLALPIILSLWFWQSEGRKGKINPVILRKYYRVNNLFLLVACLLLLVALYLTFSRGGYLGMIGGLGVILILFWKSKFNIRTKWKLSAIIGMALLILLIPGSPISDRFYSIFDLSEPSLAGRIETWQKSAEIFLSKFWLGTGLGNYSRFITLTADYRTPIYSHNTYLDIGSEMGILALLVWLFLIFGAIFSLFRKLRISMAKNTDLDGFDKAISIGLIGSLVWFSIHCLVDTPIYDPRILSILMVILALSAIIARKVPKPTSGF